MGIRVALEHRTEYTYERAVLLSPQVVRLRPAAHCRTPIESYSLRIDPQEHFLNWQQDPYGNYLARILIPERTARFAVNVGLIADMTVINPFDFFLEPEATEYPFDYVPELRRDLAPYLVFAPLGPLLAEYLRAVPRAQRRTNDFLVDLNRALQQDIRYLIRMESGVQSAEETLGNRCGSCRDSAWLLVQVLRHLGLAARFVSGYLIQLAPDQKPIEGPEGPARDFTDLHAWTEVYLPGAGWVGLDPTSGLFAGEGHIPVACTPEPSSAAPISGMAEKAEAKFSFHMAVRRLEETPRATKPFESGQWRAIDALALRIDSDLDAMDVRLTMGGEPTFVSIDDFDGEEWQTGATSVRKYSLALDLFDRLSARFGRGALHHVGQGKWYPGESLPRWSLDCFWAVDGTLLWRDPALRGDPRLPYGHDAQLASTFVRAIADRLGVDGANAIAGHEDTYYYLWRERTLPMNVDPFDSRLDDPEERARLIKVFSRGLDSVTGYALPLRAGDSGWESGHWFFRDERMFLIPGDSAMGYRLPLVSLPWESAQNQQRHIERDPMALSRDRLPSMADSIRLMQPGRGVDRLETNAGVALSADTSLVRTALCVEPREGCLRVFMPPLETADAYFALAAAIEDTAAELGTPVIIEGYTPPHDPRIEHFSVRPDPGVIEVNIHPANNWGELREITKGLYEDARCARLGTEKFAVDGRVTGTGGGGHVVLGGPSAADSPFLRRPDVLASMLAFWHNHPGLSYLFTGLFMGPTSQSPRVDEGRQDMTAELQLALDTLGRGDTPAPWLVDRSLRNILADLTGNTHRSEFCIDKLFSPDTAEGRRGLVEMRAFEMAPHAEMSLAQQALVRGLVAAFWRQPYVKRLQRWQTALYDRFMLPHFVWEDFKAALDHAAAVGYAFDPEWYRPQFEFRFPAIGAIARDGIHLELRTAMEPWHVLGETPAAGATARYVDSSLERIEVKVRGFVDSRYDIACNGWRLPLHPTGTVGEYVAGVRFRAWQPPHCLHPNIPPHAPLVFDIVDRWNQRAMGGCTYHVSHPGGRSHEDFPANSFEAESRRGARFSALGHTPGHVRAKAPVELPEAPMTLDLRLMG